MKNWETIPDNLSKAGWSWGCVSAFDCEGRTIWIADAHRGDGKRFVVRADEKQTAFLELEAAVRKRQGGLALFNLLKVLTLSAAEGQDGSRAKSVGRLPKSST